MLLTENLQSVVHIGIKKRALRKAPSVFLTISYEKPDTKIGTRTTIPQGISSTMRFIL